MKTNFTIFLCAAVIAAASISCSDDESISEADGLTSLINVTDEAPGTNCPNGGLLIETGLDTNRDEVLDSSEVTSSKFVCNGEEGGATDASKTFLVISGDLTNEEVQAVLDSETGANTQVVRIQNTTTVTDVDLSGFTELVELVVTNNGDLQTLKAPELTSIFGAFDITSNDQLQRVEFPVLESALGVTGISIVGDKIESVDFSAIQRGKLFIESEEEVSFKFPVNIPEVSLDLILGNPTLDLPIVQIDELDVSTEVTKELSFPSLERVNEINFFDAGLTSLSLPSLSFIGSSLEIDFHQQLTTFSLPSLTSLGDDGGAISLNSNSFNTATVDLILSQLAAIDPPFSEWEIYLRQSTAAPPSAQGETDAATIRANGNTVDVDVEIADTTD
ncbi:MAG: hypothetical protein AAGA66_11170 [Bacteroidota bacterium]